jgi:nucleotide-binding universal stress UspA family protein
MKISKILVPTDFSTGAQEALDYGVDLFAGGGVEIVVLHVIEPLYYATPADLYGASANLSMLLDEQTRVAKEQLAQLARRLEKRRLRIRTVLQTGSPYQLILETADKLKVDLIVMATHGRTGLSHLLMGSVAEKIVRAARCPVLTVRAYRKKGSRKPAGRRR